MYFDVKTGKLSDRPQTTKELLTTGNYNYTVKYADISKTAAGDEMLNVYLDLSHPTLKDKGTKRAFFVLNDKLKSNFFVKFLKSVLCKDFDGCINLDTLPLQIIGTKGVCRVTTTSDNKNRIYF